MKKVLNTEEYNSPMDEITHGGGYPVRVFQNANTNEVFCMLNATGNQKEFTEVKYDGKSTN